MSDGDGFAAGHPGAKINCYSGGEGGFMEWSQRIRGGFLRALLEWLSARGVRAGHLTLLSLLAGLAFCPVFLWGWPAAAFGLLFAHVLLDGLDGPLARFRGSASNRGSFTDTMADQVVVTATTLTMIHAGHASAWAGGSYVFFYTVVVGFSFVRNALAVPYSWLVRPRFLVFGWFVMEHALWPGSLDMVLWIMTVLLAAKGLTGFVKIRKRI